MKNALIVTLVLCLGIPAAAELTPGPVIPGGLSLPEVSDLDRNGLDDLIQGDSVLLNQGNGQFISRKLGLIGTDGVVDTLDVNGDGRLDLLAMDRPANSPFSNERIPPTYSIYLAGDDLSFSRVDPEFPRNIRPYIANVDGDSRDDLVLLIAVFDGSRDVATDVQVLISRGDGTFEPRAPIRIAPKHQLGRSNRILTGDINNDGITDMVIRTLDEVVVLRGIGNGDFVPETYYVPSMPFGWWVTELADVDGDGNLDVLTANFRTVRVLFGDGQGGFARLSSLYLPQLRHVELPIYAFPNDIETAQSPRNLLVGEFIQRGRIEIAAGTAEGDIVILTVEGGQLREVSRTQTEFLLPDLHAGAFRDPSQRDLYVTWNLGYPAERPTSRLVYSDPSPESRTRAGARGRVRGVRVAPSLELDLTLKASGDCVPAAAQTFTLPGARAVESSQKNAESAEAIKDGDGVLYVRLKTEWSSTPITAALYPSAKGYEGLSVANTSCGWRSIALAASRD